MLKIMAVAVLGWTPLAVTSIPDANLVLNFLMLVVLLFGAPRFFKSKAAEAQLEEKDRTITTHVQSLAAADRKAADLAGQAADLAEKAEQLTERSAKYQEIAAGFQARYDEISKYSGEHAFRALERAQAQRHIELMAVLAALQEAVGERRQSVLVDPSDVPPAP